MKSEWLTSICCFPHHSPPSPFCLSISPPLWLCHPSPLLASIPLSLQASLYILLEFRLTKDVWVSFLKQAMNGDVVKVCVCEGIAISVAVSIIFIAFHVCASVTQCREGRGVCSASVCGIGTTEGYEGDQCV